jgi:ubiquinone biosynthesis protein COQ9
VYAQQNVSGLIKKYFSNSPKQLVSFLVEQHDLDLEELNKLLLSLAKTKKELKS